jgi:hypothetical protein
MLRAFFAALVLALSALVPIAGNVSAQMKVFSDDDGNEISISGQFQVQQRTSSCSSYPIEDGNSACEFDVATSELFLRRARLVFTGKVKGWIDFKFQPDFSKINTVTLLDAYARFNFSDAARLRVGNFKRAFDGFQLTSSSQILTIERDIDIPGIPALTAVSLDELTTGSRFADRDIGIQFEGGVRGFKYWAAVMNGASDQANSDDNGKQWIGRAQYTFDLGSLPLAIAVAGALSDQSYEQENGSLKTEYTGSGEVFAQLGGFSSGPIVQAGYIFGKNPNQNKAGDDRDPVLGEPFANQYGWQVIGAYKILLEKGLEAIEPVLRVTGGDPNTDVENNGGWAITPGIELFFFGRTKLAVNWDFVFPTDSSLRSENSFKSQLQVYF